MIDAEAKLSAAKIGQSYETWIYDAVQHHLFRLEQIEARQRYKADCEAHLRGERTMQPQQWEPQYQVTRPKPEITWPGQGSGPAGSAPKPRA